MVSLLKKKTNINTIKLMSTILSVNTSTIASHNAPDTYVLFNRSCPIHTPVQGQSRCSATSADKPPWPTGSQVHCGWFHHSFNLGLSCSPSPRGPMQNLRMACQHPDVTRAMIDNDVAKGHMLGPFDTPPFENMVFSPINLVPKAGSEGKFCLIHNLSYPYTDDSINASIPQECCWVQYTHLDDVINLALQIGTSTVACCLDICSAYHNAPLNFQSIIVLGLSINGKIYVNVCLPFGAGSSCAIFERIATIIEWIVKYHGKIPYLKHYLNDYIMLANSLMVLAQQMQKFTDIMVAIGMPLAEEKTLGPGPIIEFLGMVLNFLQQLLQIEPVH